MGITVFGANGRVGRLVVTELLSQGHEVIAFVHRHADLEPHSALKIMKGNASGDPATVKTAIKGVDAVVSTLSSWGTPSKSVLTDSMRAIIPIMEAGNVQRLISLTGADAEMTGDQKSLIHRVSRTTLGIINGKILKDGEMHIRLLEQSSLNWTVVRSPVMNERGSVDYRLDDIRPLPWATINRHAVAHSIVALVESANFARQSPYIRRPV